MEVGKDIHAGNRLSSFQQRPEGGFTCCFRKISLVRYFLRVSLLGKELEGNNLKAASEGGKGSGRSGLDFCFIFLSPKRKLCVSSVMEFLGVYIAAHSGGFGLLQASAHQRVKCK